MTYLIHGTQLDQFVSILKDGYLDPYPKKRLMDDTSGLYTQLIFKDIPHEATQVTHWHPFSFIISADVLDKDEIAKRKNRIKKAMGTPTFGSVSFIHSHEIVFTEKIPLDDIIAATIPNNVLIKGEYNDKVLKKINKAVMMLKRRKIPIILDDHVGINNLLKKITI